jgi:ankyrin repeat protein
MVLHVVQLLVEHGANVNAPDENHVTPLHLASYRQRLESVRVLLNHGANVNAEDSHHRTPLHRVFEGRFHSKDGFSIVQLLVEHGADVNTKDKDHITPLHFASYRQHLESVRVLLNHGANVNAEDSHHRTPLHRVLEGPLSPKMVSVLSSYWWSVVRT